MDSLITAAARALAAGDPLGALKRVALRDDAAALALRGIAMAQLEDFPRARVLLRQAASAFGASESVARARCVVAESEVALASRDLAWPTRKLEGARATLATHGDHANAAHARYLQVRRLLLIGQLDQASSLLAVLDATALPAPHRAVHDLMLAGIAMRRIQPAQARAALMQARDRAREAGIPALSAEVERAWQWLDAPAARMDSQEGTRLLSLDDVEQLFASPTLVIDASRNIVRLEGTRISLATRPVLFSLVRALAIAWPGDVPRDALILAAFHTRHADETLRARLRVEMGRLRATVKPFAAIMATASGFKLVPSHAGEVAVMTWPVEETHPEVLALLGDGQAWSSSALALALDTSQRSVQRSLDALAADGKIQPIGRGRSRRWVTQPLPGFATTLLLPVALPGN